MGIPGLWQLISAACRTRSFTEFTVREGFETGMRGTGMMIIGFDVSPWLYEAQAAMEHARRNGASRASLGKNSELRLLAKRLSALLRCPIVPVFVLDGPFRPKTKRGTAVGVAEHWMVEDLCKLVKAYGFHVHTAPGEAEAELAYLNSIGAIDLVSTSDSDIFVFGAAQIIRSPQDHKDRDKVEIYTSSSLMHCGFGRASCLFIAIMVGGDYDNAGLRGCAFKIASKLAGSQLATDLLAAAETMSMEQLSAYLVQWRARLSNELAHDPHQLLGRHYPTLAANIPNTFPDPQILQLYAEPIISRNMPEYSPSTHTWIPRLPDTAALARLYQDLFGWRDIIDKFCEGVWDGECIRQLALCKNPLGIQDHALGASAIRHIHSTKFRLKTATTFPSYLIEIWIPTVVAAVFATVMETQAAPAGGSKISTLLWVPASILEAAAPDQVQDFHHKNPKKPRLSPMVPYNAVLSHIDKSSEPPYSKATMSSPHSGSSSLDPARGPEENLAYRSSATPLTIDLTRPMTPCSDNLIDLTSSDCFEVIDLTED